MYKLQLIQGDCLDKLKELASNSIDSIVTDPPYELGFMGKSWDNTGIANNKEMWAECLRVLKPGGHLLSFSGTRTYHRMAVAIEDAGFEIRDMINWLYGSGFPKSHNIGKAVDKIQGNKREITGKKEGTYADIRGEQHLHGDDVVKNRPRLEIMNTKGNSKWEGWGTALKPAHEPICMARKPLSEKTVAKNVLKWSTGGINIDESRVEAQGKDLDKLNSEWDREWNTDYSDYADKVGGSAGFNMDKAKKENAGLTGRFPANLIHDNSEEVRECFPDAKGATSRTATKPYNATSYSMGGDANTPIYQDNQTNASRFFKSINTQEKNCSIVINCALCGKPKKIRASLKRERNYCSLDCARKGHSKFNSQNVVCSYCGKEFIKKNSQMFTDKHFCSRECMGEWQSKFLLGENSYNWKDGKMDLISRVRSLKKMIDWRNEVYKRDDYTCQKCGDNTGGNLEAHHKKHLSDLIRELSINDITDAIESKELWDINNGITLCDECHIETHKTESKKSVLYFAKASKAERNRGCEDMEEKQTVGGGGGIGNYLDDVNSASGKYGSEKAPSKNNHPTVKPIALMEYLIKMVTPKGGIVLDPFMGSGTTGIACRKLNYGFIGIELEADYITIAKARIDSIKAVQEKLL
jgi:DNA modification methylase